jgi:hypothetical protein
MCFLHMTAQLFVFVSVAFEHQFQSSPIWRLLVVIGCRRFGVDEMFEVVNDRFKL